MPLYCHKKNGPMSLVWFILMGDRRHENSISKPDRTGTFTTNPWFTWVVKVLIVSTVIPHKSDF